MQHNPMMSPGPMNQPMNQQMAMSPAGPMGMSPQHAPQQMSHYEQPMAHHYEQPMASPPQQPVYHQPAPAPVQNVVYEQQPVRFEPVSAQGQCGDRSPQQRPMEMHQQQLVQEVVKMPEVITAPSAPPCQLDGPGFKEYVVVEEPVSAQ